MRSKLFLAGVTFAIGCGGGGGKKAMIVDAMVDSPTIDAAPTCAVTCELSSTICGTNFNMPSFPALRFGGNNTCSMTTATTCTQNSDCPTGETCRTRVEGDWFVTFDQAPLTGRKAFDIFLNMSPEGVTTPDALAIRFMKPEAPANFPLNTATAFDPNPTTQVPVAWSFWLGDVTVDGGGVIQDVRQEYYANTGMITLTAIGEADGASISGSTTPITWREIDDMGVDVPAGCTATMGMGQASGFTFNLVQMAAAFQPQQQTDDGPRQITGAYAESLRKYLDKRIAQLQQR